MNIDLGRISYELMWIYLDLKKAVKRFLLTSTAIRKRKSAITTKEFYEINKQKNIKSRELNLKMS